jgi:glycosyltransferase involved in cell wall biosynthesis
MTSSKTQIDFPPESPLLDVDDRIKIAILIPCLNEEKTITKVVVDFKTQLEGADIYVFDNASTDHTAQLAREAGAFVISEKRRGKGYTVQAMFQKIDADIYVMVDGDDTYPADRVKQLIEPVVHDRADMSIASRIMVDSKSEFKYLNRLGNVFFQNLINFIFGTHLTDILSGYRCMNKKLVKRLPLFVTGFEIEAELTVKALERGYRLLEIPVDLRPRRDGSHSKIKIVQDGIKILGTIFSLFRDYKPLTFFGSLGLISIIVGIIPGLAAVVDDWGSNLIQRLPSAILSVGLILTGLLFITIGLILHTINRRFREMEYLMRILAERTDRPAPH